MTDKIVAISLLTEKELRDFGEDLKLVYPVPADGGFDDLLKEIDRVASGARKIPRPRLP